MLVPLPPVVYRKSRAAAVFYAVPHRLAQQRLEGTGLFAVRLADFGVINTTWFDYGDSTIGAYREFSLGVVASTEHRRFRLALNLISGTRGAVGAFVLALPVDSEVARSGGVRHYGLPKTLADFQLEWSRSRLDATIADAGRRVLSMEIPLGFGIPGRVRELVVFSSRGAQRLTTTISTQWPIKIDLVGHPKLTLVDRSHPLGSLIAELDLESARPLVTVHGPLPYALLPEPTPEPQMATQNADTHCAQNHSAPVRHPPPQHPQSCGGSEMPPTPRSAESSWKPVEAGSVGTTPAGTGPTVPRKESIDVDSVDSLPPATVRSRIQ